MKAEKFFGFDEKFGHYAVMAGLVIITLIFCGEHFGWFGDDRYEKLKKSHREKVNLLTLQNQIQGREINELKEQLRLLKSSAKNPNVNQSQTGEVQVEEETQAHNPSQKNAFKASLDPSQKQEFDAEVEKLTSICWRILAWKANYRTRKSK